MDTTKIEEMTDFASGESVDKIMAYKKSSEKVAWINVSALTGGGYCGRKWSLTQSSPIAAGVTGNIDKLVNFVNLAGIGCYLVQNNHERRKLNASNHYLFATGETAALDGSMGHYQWGTGVPLYYAPYVGSDGYFHEDWDFDPIPGHYNYYIPVMSRSAAGYATLDRTNGNLVSYINSAVRYRGGNNNAALDGAFNSQILKPATNISADAFATAARLNGARWEANWYAHLFITGALFRLLFGTRNVQTGYNAALDTNGLHQGGLGQGVDVATNWDTTFLYYPYVNLDCGVSLADACGIATTSITLSTGGSQTITNIPCMFGLKNFYKYLYLPIRGMISNLNADHTADCYIYPKLNSVKPAADSIATYTKIASSPALADANWHFPKNISFQNLCGWPTSWEGTESTYFPDGYMQNVGSGLRGPFGAGSALNGGVAGLGCLSGSAGVGWTNANVGASLCESYEDWDTTPFFVD